MQFIEVGTQPKTRKIARVHTRGNTPGLFWLGGLKSDMSGTKAVALDKIGRGLGLGVTRFDYSGHGQSEGEFESGTISLWLEEAVAVFDTTKGEQIIVGSSMGGWLAFLLNRYLRQRGEERIKALIVIAPAIDMTHDLMLANFTAAELAMLEKNGRVEQPSDYEEPYVLTRELINDGERHLMFGAAITTGCPVRIVQGGRDIAVPPSHALKLVSHLLSAPVTLSLIPDGDHSLSRKQDLKMLERAIVEHI